LEARQIDGSNGKLTAEVTGEADEEDGALVIRRIHVLMRLVAPEETGEKVERVHAVYATSCPLYRTSHNAIPLISSFDYRKTGQPPPRSADLPEVTPSTDERKGR